MQNNTQIGFFVMSCDKTSDVASYFAKSFKKYFGNTPIPIFFGVNENVSNCEYLNAIPIKSFSSNWRNETIQQLNEIKKLNPDLTHLVVLLDDFIFLKQPDKTLYSLIGECVEKKIKYLRVKPVEEGLFYKFCNKFRSREDFKYANVVKIRKSHPYYCSLQIAVWDINYLIDLVTSATSIWNFENQGSDESHYSTTKSLIFYKHIVEKGQWDLNAKEICMEHIGEFNSGVRKRREIGLLMRIKIFAQRISFLLFGYLFLKLRKKIEI